MKKHKHHYVWEHYLTAWATNGRVWCATRGKRFPTNTENVGQQRDFYRLKEMSERDVQFVELLIGRMAGPWQALAREWIPQFRVFHDVKRAYEASGRSSPELEKLLDETINNLEEDMHAAVEDKAVPLLARLKAADASFLDSDDDATIHFFWFLGLQYLRTPRMAREVVAASTDIPGFNAEAAWGLIRTIFATSLGYSFYRRRTTRRLTFIDAPAPAEFIAGDQPIINIAAIGLPDGQEPREGQLELYYPLTPTRAMLIAFDATQATIQRRSVTTTETRAYNEMIVQASSEQVYARSEKALAGAAQ